jgi:uncharacterized protein (TIRG00374 family)
LGGVWSLGAILILKSKRFWATVLALVFLVWCLYDLDLRQVGQTVARLHYGYLIWAMLVVVGILYIRSARWRILVNPMKAVGSSRMFSIYSLGQLGNLLFPAGTGTALRVLILHKSEGVSKTGGASTIMLETLLDGLSLAIFMAGASAALVLPDWLKRGRTYGAVVITVLLGLLIAAVALRDPVGRKFEQWESSLSAKWHARLLHLWTHFQQGVSSMRSLKHLSMAVVTSVASWLGQLTVISLVLHTFGFALPAGAALVLMVMNTLLLIVPVTPGNVGTYQVATVFGLSLFNVPKTEAVSFGIVLQATTYLPIACVGFYQYFRYARTLGGARLSPLATEDRP